MLEELKRLINKIMPEVNTEGVTEETKLFDDLKFDSIGLMMLAMAILDEYGIEFNDAPNFVTVGDVIKYIETNKK